MAPPPQTADPTPLFPTGSLLSPPSIKPDDDEPGKLILESVSNSDSLDGSREHDLEIESSLNSLDAESPIHFDKKTGVEPTDDDSLRRRTDETAQEGSSDASMESKSEDQGPSNSVGENIGSKSQGKEEILVEPSIKEEQMTRSASTGCVKSLLVSIPLSHVKLDSSGDLEMVSDEDEFNYDDYLDQLNDEEEEDVVAPAIGTALGELTRPVNKKKEVSLPSDRKSFAIPVGKNTLRTNTSSPVNLSSGIMDGSNPLDEDFPSVDPVKKTEKLVREDSGDTTLCSLFSQDSIDDAIASEEGKVGQRRGERGRWRKGKRERNEIDIAGDEGR